MSLWDWLLAAWIYEELFDDDSNDPKSNKTYNRDLYHDYDFKDDF